MNQYKNNIWTVNADLWLSPRSKKALRLSYKNFFLIGESFLKHSFEGQCKILTHSINLKFQKKFVKIYHNFKIFEILYWYLSINSRSSPWVSKEWMSELVWSKSDCLTLLYKLRFHLAPCGSLNTILLHRTRKNE